MQILKTDKDTLTSEDILKYIADYELKEVPSLNKLWRYYKGDNPTIKDKQKMDENGPDNRTPVPYGRKIVTTFTGYAYRPKYITYKARDNSDADQDTVDEETGNPIPKQENPYITQLEETFALNQEHIKTSRSGRNTAIFGVAYELMYIEGTVTGDKTLPVKAEPRFINVDPREVILFYDYSPEPQKKIGIRYYKVSEDLYKVEVYYLDRVELYDRYREKTEYNVDTHEWKLRAVDVMPNFFQSVPIVAYYFGDDMQGVIEPVTALIDNYDYLHSDYMNEIDRFAGAYLIMKKTSLDPNNQKKDPWSYRPILKWLKRFRVFENVPPDGDIKYLTKDIPDNYMRFMTDLVKDQIHVQSHVPDFATMTTGDLSGAAISRLLFDFENVVSSAEADFDTGLNERLRLINVIYQKAGRETVEPKDIVITHRRNLPSNLKEFAEIANIMKQAGFSAELIADIMPDDVLPNVETELERQRKEQEAAIPNVDTIPPPDRTGNDTNQQDNNMPMNQSNMKQKDMAGVGM